MKTYDCVLLERPFWDALTKNEVRQILEMLPEGEAVIPIEIDSKGGSSCAMGFLTQSAEDKMDGYHDALNDMVGNILADMRLEKESCVYDMNGLFSIYLARNLEDPVLTQRIRIPVTENTAIVAEQGMDPDYKELYIGLEHDGIWEQDLAIVRECYSIEDGSTDPTPQHGHYEVLIYEDEATEDWTNRFCIDEWEVKDE